MNNSSNNSCIINKFEEIWDKYPKNIPFNFTSGSDWSTQMIMFQIDHFKILCKISMTQRSKTPVEILTIIDTSEPKKIVILNAVNTNGETGLINLSKLRIELEAKKIAPVTKVREHLVAGMNYCINEDSSKWFVFLKTIQNEMSS